MHVLNGGRDKSHGSGDQRREDTFEIGYLSPLGPMRILGSAVAIFEVRFCRTDIASFDESPTTMLLECRSQLDGYFGGRREVFDLRLEPRGTPFHRRVWQKLLRIPYGETRSYKDIARDVGSIHAARAVGMANARNPISVIIPCHRVIGVRGELVGYGGGLCRKRWLLDHERIRNGMDSLAPCPSVFGRHA